MTVYAKNKNGKLISAYNGYNGITGFADNIDLMIESDFLPYDDIDFDLYLSGAKILSDDGELVNNADYANVQLEQAKEVKKTQIIAQLDAIDLKSIRALRANEAERLEELEAEAVRIRGFLVQLDTAQDLEALETIDVDYMIR